MSPLLRDGDGLHIVPYRNRVIRKGDVIVFIPSGSELKIVHRRAYNPSWEEPKGSPCSCS
jgi:hypothetical protein